MGRDARYKFLILIFKLYIIEIHFLSFDDVLIPGTGGCGRRTQLNCSGDGFIRVSGVKVPETRYSWYNSSVNLVECRQLCLTNCSCTAYANLDIRNGGSGCLLWFTDLMDIRYLTDSGQDIFVRVAASEIGMKYPQALKTAKTCFFFF